nr:immunoglobulin heavy chain junction region [Mus musculus]
CAIGKYYFDYW